MSRKYYPVCVGDRGDSIPLLQVLNYSRCILVKMLYWLVDQKYIFIISNINRSWCFLTLLVGELVVYFDKAPGHFYSFIVKY